MSGEPRDLPLVPGGSDRDAVVEWFMGAMDGSSAARRAATILDSLLAQAAAEAVAARDRELRAAVRKLAKSGKGRYLEGDNVPEFARAVLALLADPES